MRRAHPDGIVGPSLGQIKRPIDEGMTVTGYISGEYANLAVGDLIGRACILPGDAAGRLALFEKSSFIEDQDGILVSEISTA